MTLLAEGGNGTRVTAIGAKFEGMTAANFWQSRIGGKETDDEFFFFKFVGIWNCSPNGVTLTRRLLKTSEYRKEPKLDKTRTKPPSAYLGGVILRAWGAGLIYFNFKRRIGWMGGTVGAVCRNRRLSWG